MQTHYDRLVADYVRVRRHSPPRSVQYPQAMFTEWTEALPRHRLPNSEGTILMVPPAATGGTRGRQSYLLDTAYVPLG